MTKSHTDRAKFVFTVKEFGDGTPFLMAEPSRRSLTVLGNGFISFDLAAGTTYDQAKEIARYFNTHLDMVAYTHFEE